MVPYGRGAACPRYLWVGSTALLSTPMKSIIIASVASLLLAASRADAQSLYWSLNFTDSAVDWPIWELQIENDTPVGHSYPTEFSVYHAVGSQHGTDVVVGGASGVAHGLDDLSNLHIGLSLKVADNVTYSNTGAVYASTSIPAPGSAILAAAAISLTLLRRRRRDRAA
jgi:hypothetical protein